MIHFDIVNFRNLLKPNYRLLGLDVGGVRTGCALSDYGQMLATPYCVLNLKKQKITPDSIRNLIEKEDIYGIVVGNPLKMDGETGDACIMVNKFIEKFLLPLNQPIFMQDERLTTSAVNRFLKEKGFSRKQQEEVNDQEAASYILQTVLDKLRV